MYLTTKVQLTQNNKDNINLDILYKLAYHNARLYNVGLYNVRQHFFNTNSYLSYFSNHTECQTNENYALLLTDCAQQTLRLVDRDMNSFFKLLKAKKYGKYPFPVHLPKYKDKEGIMPFAVQGRSCRIQKNGTVAIGLTKEFRDLYGITERRFLITIPRNLRDIPIFKEMRFIPRYGGKEFQVEFVYDSSYIQTPQIDSSKTDGYMSIDLGVTNLFACTTFSNGGASQFIIDGRRIKAINHYYNKAKARLQKEYSHNKSINGMNTKRFIRLSKSRLNKIDAYFNESIKCLISKCFALGISTIVVGYNKGWKQEVETGKNNNQKFVSIPYHRFRQKLSYKCELCGITCAFQEESYTSKASSIDMDEIPVYSEDDDVKYAFSGKRVKRGLYKSKDGLLLNADINGSVNILRKYLNECNAKALCADAVRALVNVPCQRINVLCTSPSL